MKEEIGATIMREILGDYSAWLHKNNYIDADYYTEEPKAIDRYLEERLKVETENQQKKMKKIRDPQLKDFRLIPHTAGIIMNGIFVKKDNSEIIIKSAFGGQWTFRPLKENERSL